MQKPLVSDAIAALKPYEAGKPVEEVERELGIKDALKLASNENAWGAPPAALEAARQSLAHLETYPDAASFHLRTALAAHHGLDRDHIVVGNGSNELIGMIVRVFVEPGERVASSAGSFIAYRIAARSHGHAFDESSLGPDMGYDLDALASVVTADTRVIFIANPNNPTGSYLTHDRLAKILTDIDARDYPKGPPLVVLDEAYVDYVDRDEKDRNSGISIFKTRPRVILLRTFSKAYGLAALRVGYAICEPEIANYLNRVRDPFNLNVVGQAAALAALTETAWVAQTTRSVITERRRVAEHLVAMGLEPVPSEANFILVHVGQDARALNDRLMRQAVIARPMTPAGLPEHLRITIGRPEDNDRMLEALARVLA
jgi:histidinol-phosphate aminotransferase